MNFGGDIFIAIPTVRLLIASSFILQLENDLKAKITESKEQQGWEDLNVRYRKQSKNLARGL